MTRSPFRIIRDVVWHEHIFSPLTDLEGDGVEGRFDAIEETNGKISVLDVGSDMILCEYSTRREAIDAARVAAKLWRPSNSDSGL